MSTRERVARNSQTAEPAERSRRERHAPGQWWQGTAEQPAGDAEGSAATPPTGVVTQPKAPPEARALAPCQQQAHRQQRPAKRSKAAVAAAAPPGAEERLASLTQQVTELHGELEGLRSEVTTLRGRVDSYDITAERMRDHAVQQARLFEEVRKLKKVAGVDAAPGDASAGPSGDDAAPSASTSLSDPACSACGKRTAYDMPLKRLMGALTGADRLNLTDLFTLPGGRVKANSALKKLVRCDDCMDKGSLRLVVCTSGGAGNRLTCNWCRCRMTTNTTDAASMWCGKRHSSCRQLVIENETDRQGNTLFLSKGLAPVKDVVPFDELQLVDVDLSSAYNNCDYALVATSSLGKALVLIEIDNSQHAGCGQYSPELEQQKNSGNLACGKGFDRVLLLRISPSGQYKMAEGEEGNIDKKARWLIARDWIVCFLRAPWGAWTLGGDTGRTLVYLFYTHNSDLIDRRPQEFTTVVAYRAPALPTPPLPDLADWACTLDPYLAIKGSMLAQEHLALAGRHLQPVRS